METLGFIAYIILLIIALGWIIGVRIKLGLINSTILGSLFFTASAIVLPLIKASLIHSLWIIPAGFLVSIVSAYIMPHSKLFTKVVNLLVNTYAGIIRIGIDKEKIKESQKKSIFNAIE